jgi:hypothetical protein
MNWQTYRDLFQTPIGKLLAAYGLARLPVGINALAIAMAAQAASGSAAVAGWASAAYLVALGIQNPLLGRWIDRRGPQGTIGFTLVLHTLAQFAYVAAIAYKAPTAVLLLCAVFAGASMPPVSAIFRSALRKSGLPEAQRHAAFALDAVLVELCFIGGPLIAAVFAAYNWPSGALIASAVFAIVGSWWFVASGGVRAWGQVQASSDQSLLGPLRDPVVRWVLILMAVFGIGIGFLEMGLTAAAVAFGKASGVGWSFAAISLSSALAGVWHGSKTLSMSQRSQFTFALTWLALGTAATALAPTQALVWVTCFVLGVGFAPAFTAIKISTHRTTGSRKGPSKL